MNFLVGYLVGFLLFILPLHRTVSIGQISWTIPEWVLILFLLGWYGWNLLKPGSKKEAFLYWSVSALGTGVLILSSLVGYFPLNRSEFLRVIIILWAIPFFKYTIDRLGRRQVVVIFLTVIALHAAWGVSQFIIQRDIGLPWLGESRLTPDAVGVAKFSLPQAGKMIRAYGPYAHPNSLAGVLVLGFLLLTTTHHVFNRRIKFVLGGLFWIAILLTFSRAGITSAGLGMVLAIFFNWRREKKEKFDLQRSAGERTMMVIMILITLVLLPLWIFRLTDLADRATSDRVVGSQWALALLEQYGERGVGPGNYPRALATHLTERGIEHAPWQIDFVHTIPFLFVVEWGLIGVVSVGTLVFFFRQSLPLATAGVILLVLAPPLLLDHYFLTQTAPLLFLLLTVLLMEPWPQESESTLPSGKRGRGEPGQ